MLNIILIEAYMLASRRPLLVMSITDWRPSFMCSSRILIVLPSIDVSMETVRLTFIRLSLRGPNS